MLLNSDRNIFSVFPSSYSSNLFFCGCEVIMVQSRIMYDVTYGVSTFRVPINQIRLLLWRNYDESYDVIAVKTVSECLARRLTMLVIDTMVEDLLLSVLNSRTMEIGWCTPQKQGWTLWELSSALHHPEWPEYCLPWTSQRQTGHLVSKQL